MAAVRPPLLSTLRRHSARAYVNGMSDAGDSRPPPTGLAARGLALGGRFRGWLLRPMTARLVFGLLAFNILLQFIIKGIDVVAAGEYRNRMPPDPGFRPLWPYFTDWRDRLLTPIRGRLDDAFFWAQVAVTLACWRLARLSGWTARPARAGLTSWIVYLLRVLAYVGGVLLEPGTFFIIRPRPPVPQAMQDLEGALHPVLILLSLYTARLGFSIAREIELLPDAIDDRERLAAAASAPAWGFSIYLFVYQVIVASPVTQTEVWATFVALVCYGSPFAALLITSVLRWRRHLTIRWPVLNPFGIELRPKRLPIHESGDGATTSNAGTDRAVPSAPLDSQQ